MSVSVLWQEAEPPATLFQSLFRRRLRDLFVRLSKTVLCWRWKDLWNLLFARPPVLIAARVWTPKRRLLLISESFHGFLVGWFWKHF